ncbi:DNA-directed RNA polymerase subunit beta' [Tripterygium wilfordii]|uniref:DNA-directed RNA polymerase subunit beta n=1 Tax=Tripterygium wilfordii TaxID=458696 RepID=A0A7J7D713_TRIWF|nr:uncharacterized protein LOC120004787 [Tripterygium wilfordii]KAF5742101.1 DNA-directed RNA polymerase subunit beta' [Tripterygium wilfordii]
MLAIQASYLVFNKLIVPSSPSPLFSKRNNGRKRISTLAKRNDLPEKSRIDQKPIFPLKVSNALLARSLVGVFALGFIDAGYSGDWSRIGVISKEIEDLLKIAAFVILPLCIFFIFNIYNEQES